MQMLAILTHIYRVYPCVFVCVWIIHCILLLYFPNVNISVSKWLFSGNLHQQFCIFSLALVDRTLHVTSLQEWLHCTAKFATLIQGSRQDSSDTCCWKTGWAKRPVNISVARNEMSRCGKTGCRTRGLIHAVWAATLACWNHKDRSHNAVLR
jgi:hypothetical protein